MRTAVKQVMSTLRLKVRAHTSKLGMTQGTQGTLLGGFLELVTARQLAYAYLQFGQAVEGHFGDLEIGLKT